ncbi:Ig-like domain-containing protein [Pseudomonas sp. CP4]|uniref:Ig-like domain-containing protein n=1 Tax=Pseudomonas sp. CP4 TaxID=3388844 RepID=UPI0039F13CCE
MTIKELYVSALGENSPLALNPPSIPTSIANGGLRWQDLNDPSSPVQVQIVLQPGAVQLNDLCVLEWQRLPVASDTVNADHLSTGVITLSVSPADILEHPDGVHSFQYFVTAAIGGQTDSSPPATVKVKRLLPGGNTGDDAGTEYINENLRAPMGIPELIDDAIAEPGVTGTIAVYDNMAVGDRIQIDWGGLRLPRPPLTASEVGKPVEFRVEKATLVAAPGRVIVRYDIRDEVNNWSRWSLHVTTDVEAGENLLAAPRVLDAPGGTLDLALLGDQDARVQTPVYTERMDLGDRVYLTWLGYTAEGLEVKVELDKEVDSGDIGWPLDFEIPNDKVRAIAQGNAVVRYEVVPLTGTPRRSRRTTVEVIGQVERLPAPIVAGIVGNVLDPASLPPEGALVRIERHDLIEAGDTLLLLWDGKTDSGASLPHTISIPVTGSGAVNGIERRIPLIYITPLQGGTVTVSYTLTKSGGETLPSNQLPLQVKSLGAQLPKPTVDYAQGDTLDPEVVPPDGTYIRVNYSMETADRIDVHWDGVLDFTDWFQIPANWGGKEVEFPVAKTYVDLNKDQRIEVYYIVTRGGQPLPASVKQPLLIGTAVELNAPRIKEADDNSLAPLKAKDALSAIVPAYDNMVGTQLSVTWTGTPGGGSHTTEPVDVTTEGDCEVPLPNSVVAFNLNKPVTVCYTVIRNDSPKNSKELLLAVQPIADEDPAMGRPFIEEAGDEGQGPELDVGQLTRAATIRVNSWPLIALRQYVWLRLSGTNSNDSAYTQTFWQPPGSQTNQTWIGQGYYTHTIPLATLQNLKDGSELIVEFKVGLGGSQLEAEAVTFQSRTYTVNASVPLEIDTTDMVLDGPQFYPASAPYAPPFQKSVYLHPKSFQIRQAEGGTGPYRYSSSNSTVASVDPATGRVISTGIGTATIKVHDAKSGEVNYDVICRNVYELVCNQQRISHAQATAWKNSVGANFFSYDANWTAVCASFQQLNPPGSYFYWYIPQQAGHPAWQAPVCKATGSIPTPSGGFGIQGIGNGSIDWTLATLAYRPRNAK